MNNSLKRRLKAYLNKKGTKPQKSKTKKKKRPLTIKNSFYFKLVSLNLTRREYEILVLICDELTNTEIGKKLELSVRTVDTHRRNLLRKTGSNNAIGLCKYALRNKLYKL